MKFIDLWTIVTGIASIISLLIVMSDKLPKWRKYISSLGFSLAGFAIGRISVGTILGVEQTLKDSRLTGFLMILGVIFVMLYLFLREMVKRKQDFMAYMVVFMVLVIVVPQIMDKYFDAFPGIHKEDYLLLANTKEKNNDIAGAIKYLQLYKDLTPKKDVKDQIEKKILSLEGKQLKID